MENNKTSRVERIRENMIKAIWQNGGHWAMLNMRNGDKMMVQRRCHEHYEDLEREKFLVKVNDAKVLDIASAEEVAEYINVNY